MFCVEKMMIRKYKAHICKSWKVEHISGNGAQTQIDTDVKKPELTNPVKFSIRKFLFWLAVK